MHSTAVSPAMYRPNSLTFATAALHPQVACVSHGGMTAKRPITAPSSRVRTGERMQQTQHKHVVAPCFLADPCAAMNVVQPCKGSSCLGAWGSARSIVHCIQTASTTAIRPHTPSADRNCRTPESCLPSSLPAPNTHFSKHSSTAPVWSATQWLRRRVSRAHATSSVREEGANPARRTAHAVMLTWSTGSTRCARA